MFVSVCVGDRFHALSRRFLHFSAILLFGFLNSLLLFIVTSFMFTLKIKIDIEYASQ